MMRFARYFGISVIALGLATACPDDDEPAGEPYVPQTFNYIPINEDVCSAADADYDHAAVTATRDELLATDSGFVARGLEVCSENMLSTCPACTPTDNPLMQMITEFDMWGDMVHVAFEFPSEDGTLESYFRRALEYPHRWATLFFDPSNQISPLTFAQSAGHMCTESTSVEGRGCASYSFEPESLNDDCETFGLQLFGQSSRSGDTVTFTSQTSNAGTQFGFFVPLTETLPDVDEFVNDGAVQLFMSTKPSLAVKMEYVQAELNVDESTGKGCGRITGFVRRDVFSPLVHDVNLLNRYLYTDPDGVIPPGYIKGVLNLEVHAAPNGGFEVPMPGMMAMGGGMAMDLPLHPDVKLHPATFADPYPLNPPSLMPAYSSTTTRKFTVRVAPEITVGFRPVAVGDTPVRVAFSSNKCTGQLTVEPCAACQGSDGTRLTDLSHRYQIPTEDMSGEGQYVAAVYHPTGMEPACTWQVGSSTITLDTLSTEFSGGFEVHCADANEVKSNRWVVGVCRR